MGSHVNYYMVIEHLIVLRKDFSRITKDRFQPIIKELSTYEIYPHSDNEHLPDHKQLAVKLKYTQGKMNSLLKDLLNELVREFHYPPLEVKNHILKFFIHIPWDEERNIPNKKFVEESRQNSLYIEMTLPVTPRIGEQIEIPFIQETGKFYKGYVHEIEHKIIGSTQEIHVMVHPWDDFYYKWEKMREEFERRKRWLASL